MQAELERLESEEEQLKRSLSDLAKRQAPVERVSDDARSFLASWQDVGELLEAATPEERLQILQHYIEVVEVGPIDPQTRTSTYLPGSNAFTNSSLIENLLSGVNQNGPFRNRGPGRPIGLEEKTQ